MNTAPVVSRANAWIVGDDTGISSKAIWSVMQGVRPTRTAFGCHPHDPSDFGRCYRLLKFIPEWRARLDEMAIVDDTWRRLVAEWDSLTALYEEEAGDKLEDRYGWSAPQLYARMQSITDKPRRDRAAGKED